jgi:hemolysin activation/secretion protein/AraC-like DNA-binding protein
MFFVKLPQTVPQVMAFERHLILQQLILRPAGEWRPGGTGWTVVRVVEGVGYGMEGGQARELTPGDGCVTVGTTRLVVRASQLNQLKLEFFQVQPQYLNGLLTVAEDHQLQHVSAPAGAPVLGFVAADRIGQRFAHLSAQPQRESLAVRSALLQLWAQAVAPLLQAAAAAQPANPKMRERFRQMVAEMPDAELAVRSLTELAEQLNCSERHFSRLFREEFGVALRTRQTELRLVRARQLLADGNAKIINVAYESGYRHLGLFNAMFKKRFGMTPSEWRTQHPVAESRSPLRHAAPALVILGMLAGFFLGPALRAQPADSAGQATARAALEQKLADLGAPVSPVKTNAPPVAPLAAAVKKNPNTNAGPVFKAHKYLIMGNTVLPPPDLSRIFTNEPAAFGDAVAFTDIRSALGELQSAYRERGFVTVSVGLPPQKLTNATVKVKVTEGRLAAIHVKGNHYFSVDNVMRVLPSLHTNMLLNSHVFQRELDNANANRDRQIYPVIGPGPEPGTSELTLKVKDTLPLHARVEISSDSVTPNTPDSRVAFNAQYDNLWQLEHQFGLNYSFTPVNYKSESDAGSGTNRYKINNYVATPFDNPLIANYGAYYRIPLGAPEAVQNEIDQGAGSFGYDEATHRFRLPPPAGRPDLTFFASRSVSGTDPLNGPLGVVTQTTATNAAGSAYNPLTITTNSAGQNFTLNEGLGFKVNWPLPPLARVNANVSFGFDCKHYQTTAYNTNVDTFTIQYYDSAGNPVYLRTNINQAILPVRPQQVDYFPVNLGFSGARPDAYGSTMVNAQANYNLATAGSLQQLAYSAAAGKAVHTNAAAGTSSTNLLNQAGNNYVTVQAGATREQRLYKDWTALIHADGQWASCPLFSNEQFAMGGPAGVRGYDTGEAYGDTGWRVSFEPRTPMVNIGLVDGTVPFWVRGSVFIDYGETYLLQKVPGTRDTQKFCGYGSSLTANIGSHMDGRLTVAIPVISTAYIRANDVQVYFGVGAQF